MAQLKRIVSNTASKKEIWSLWAQWRRDREIWWLSLSFQVIYMVLIWSLDLNRRPETCMAKQTLFKLGSTQYWPLLVSHYGLLRTGLENCRNLWNVFLEHKFFFFLAGTRALVFPFLKQTNKKFLGKFQFLEVCCFINVIAKGKSRTVSLQEYSTSFYAATWCCHHQMCWSTFIAALGCV